MAMTVQVNLLGPIIACAGAVIWLIGMLIILWNR